MRATVGAVAAVVLMCGSAHGATLWTKNVAEWHAGAYSGDDGKFSHCAASARYKSGILLLFSINKNYQWSMGFSSTKWRLNRGATYDISYRVDGHPAERASAKAQTTDLVIVTLKDSVRLFNTFRQGRRLYVHTGRDQLAFNLTQSSRVLAFLGECVKIMTGPTSGQTTADTNPFGPPAAAPPRASGSGSTLDQERAEAAVVAANLLADLRLDGFRLLRRDEMPASVKSDAMWTAASGVGIVNVHPAVRDVQALSAELIAGDAKSCKKAFASGSLPQEPGSAMSRLFTRCGVGDDGMIVSYYIVPRTAGGVYVIGTFVKREDETSRALDAGIRAAVARALPR